MYMILTFHFHTKVYKLKTKLRPLTHMHLMSNSFITNGVQKMITEWRTDRRTDGRPKQMPQATLRTLWRWHTSVNQSLDSLKDTVRNPKKTYHTVFPSHTDFPLFFPLRFGSVGKRCIITHESGGSSNAMLGRNLGMTNLQFFAETYQNNFKIIYYIPSTSIK